ncbi:hypothetical protein [Mesorhizobium delmotii]|uniref:Uncharacterized protein n=1 Tax=Mesorhizobium delmotii TaxID=1631247 RepID=A0A2P9AHN7_9HYPH|nr:hypothetical protein [Mesorhizobium delmotii]SJM30639.1 exported hypothetical protein [Mesorhizobium delmotii]
MLAKYLIGCLFVLLTVSGPKEASAQNALCLQGYVWRDARPGDGVCVIPQSRTLAADENAKAHLRREPGPRDGVFWCLSGFVWREAFQGDTVCVIPAARQRVRDENALASSRTIGGGSEFDTEGQHTLLVGVTAGRDAWQEKTYGSTCGKLDPMPNAMGGMVGWGQAEIGWLGDNCFAFVLERAVQFDRTLMDLIPGRIIDRVVLSYDEVEAPSCPLVAGYAYRCWQNGEGHYQHKTDGCVVVRIPSFDWPRSGGAVQGRLPTFEEWRDQVSRINARQWDVTSAVNSQLNGPPLGGLRGYGLLLTGGPSLAGLTAQDNTVCVSELQNITFEITYTVPPAGVFHPVH